MKKLLCLLFFVLLVTAGCGDGSSGLRDTGFTTNMIDDDTYYLSYEKDEQTVQSTIVFSGDSATVTDEWYDKDGVFQFSGSYELAITLNEDGTITGTGTSYGGADTLTETSISSDGTRTVEWTYDTKTWSDEWSVAKPEDWYEKEVFTADMIDNDTYYVSYDDDMLTVQETITFSGDATSGYTVTVVLESYDAEGVQDSTQTNTYGIILNDDGTLTTTTDEGTGTFTLISQSDDSLVVLGADVSYTYTGTDAWAFSEPEDWF